MKTENVFERFFELSSDLMCVAGIDGYFKKLNSSWERALGWSRQELLAESIGTFIHPDDIEATFKEVEKQISGETTAAFVNRYRHKDGSYRWLEWVATPAMDGNLYACARDITERKRSEEALAQSEQRFRRYFDLGLIGMAITSLEKGWVEFNDTLFKMFGYSRESFAKLTWTELTYPEDLESDLAQFSRVLAGKIDGYSMEKRFIHKDGNIFHAVISANAIRRDDGSVDYFVALVHDISESKSVELKLMEQKSALQQKNIALNEILGQIEIEKKQIKDNVIANAENLLLPVIQKLKLTVESRKYVRLLQLNLQELTSSFGVKLTGKEFKLTSREIEICNLIKNGLTSKEITTILNISHGTTERHRANIRRKLGIIKKDINLSSFLKTL